MKENNEKALIEWPEGIKKTRQREAVFEVLTKAEEPLSAHEIYRQIEKQESGDNYAVSTVYRALAVFEEKDLVIKSTLMGDDTAVYAWKKETHKHYAICLKCHKLVPLKSCPFEHAAMHTKDEEFQITGHKIELYGYCKQCK